ncbi:hypothetical protein EI427_13555 [Flammeovirga pectinis]|uniref:Uncharacterized protein n=1 Tax=Flammeovirga pectinis TaxID=2494373 RepID=A0A3S9P4U0_9BACT|nr:hypothetical protein [Flammeovirga pectinis]AZQ63230.1 hypothetical protein EI427_13555 [Flammeovirga pectinis]
MKQTFIYICVILCLLLDGCVPKVCPAYSSAFYQKDDPNNPFYVTSTRDTTSDYFVPYGDTTYTINGKVTYISYFKDDSLGKDEELFASRETEWNGLVKPRGGLYGKYTHQDRKLASKNYPQTIQALTKNPYPIELTEEDSIIDFIPEDSIYLVSSSDSLENALFGGGPGYDDSRVAKELPEQKERTAEEPTSDSLPPMRYDGYVYMQRYGDRVALEDSMRAGYFIVPDSMYLVERKWFEIWKPKHYMIPKRVLDQKDADKLAKIEADSLSKLPQYDSTGQLIEKKKLFGKKNKEESEELSTDLPEDDDSELDESSNGKKKKKNKDTKTEETEEDEDW